MTTLMATVGRVIIGSTGGLTAVLAKYIAQDHDYIANLDHFRDQRFNNIMFGYIIMTPILLILGGIMAGISDEVNRWKLLAIGIAAPALVTTMAGGAPPNRVVHPGSLQQGPAGWNIQFAPIGTAFAADQSVQMAQFSVIQKGVGAFFGAGKDKQSYWVIVYSSIDEKSSILISEKINKQDQSMKAFVGRRAPGNEYYPVIVGGYLPYNDAMALKEKASRLTGISEPYLSAFPDRRP